MTRINRCESQHTFQRQRIADDLWQRYGLLLKSVVLIVFLPFAVTMSSCKHRPPEASSSMDNHSPSYQPGDFLGSATCLSCHADIVKNFLQTGHAQTFFDLKNSTMTQKWVGRHFADPERNVTFVYENRPAGGLQVTIPEKFGSQAFPLQYLLGSNQQAATIITLVPGEDGETACIEHRVSLFQDDLKLTPGQQGIRATEPVEEFGKLQSFDTADRCIGCHTTTHEIRNHQLVNVIPNVQCEACHGPGREHVANAERGIAASSLLSLKAETAQQVMKQIQACGKCHRLPEDLPPQQLTSESKQLARFQPAALLQSACFKKSGGLLSCSKCHDPHLPSGSDTEKVVRSCLECHAPETDDQVACPVSSRQDCIRCHMPPIEVHSGVYFHDHWIRVRKPGKT